MQYPFHTESKPAVGDEGKRIIEAVQNGVSITNNEAQATISRILQRRKVAAHAGKNVEVR